MGADKCWCASRSSKPLQVVKSCPGGFDSHMLSPVKGSCLLQIPVLEKLKRTIEEVGAEQGYLYIFEVNSGLTLFHSSKSEDVTPMVKTKLGI